MNDLEFYKASVAAQDNMHLAGIKTNINLIDKKRARKMELQAAVNEYSELEEEIRELREATKKLAQDMTFRNPNAGYLEYVEKPIPDYAKDTEELKKILNVERFPSYKEVEEGLQRAYEE